MFVVCVYQTTYVCHKLLVYVLYENRELVVCVCVHGCLYKPIYSEYSLIRHHFICQAL